jgi:hypothetical protein
MVVSSTAFIAPGHAESGIPDLNAPQEHPEHPAGAEHPEHPAEEESGTKAHAETIAEEGSAAKEEAVSKKMPVTIESVAVYLEGYVAEKSAKSGGWFKIQDETAEETLELQLDKIHRERLAQTDEGTYFVCADFRTEKGKLYDLDFWVKETEEGLKVTEKMVHKEEGKPRYTWVEKDGIWSRKPLD